MLRSGGAWQSTVGVDLAGRTLGIIGLGKIGCLVADAAIKLGMEGNNDAARDLLVGEVSQTQTA